MSNLQQGPMCDVSICAAVWFLLSAAQSWLYCHDNDDESQRCTCSSPVGQQNCVKPTSCSAELQTYEPDCQHPENTLPMSPDSLSFICLTTQEVIRDPQFILFGWSPAGFHPFPDSRGHAVSFRAELVILFGFKDASTAAGALLFFSWRHRWNM